MEMRTENHRVYALDNGNYDSDIYNDERRIAFRYDPMNRTYWHFMMQTIDGEWAEKLGNSNSAQLNSSYNPSMDSVWGQYLHNQETHYYAIKRNYVG